MLIYLNRIGFYSRSEHQGLVQHGFTSTLQAATELTELEAQTLIDTHLQHEAAKYGYGLVQRFSPVVKPTLSRPKPKTFFKVVYKASADALTEHTIIAADTDTAAKMILVNRRPGALIISCTSV